MDSSLPLSAAAYRPSIRAPSRMQPPPTISSPSFPTTPDDPPAHLDFTSAAAPLPTQPVTAWSFPTMIDASVDAYATTAATAMPPQFSYSRDGSRSKACAVCRFRNQKCKDDCLLAPFFPASEDSKFQKARRLFGVSKMQKILKGLLPEQRAVAMATMIYEAEVHAAHPNTGCLDIILQLHSQIERRAAHLAFLRQHAAVVAPPAPSLDTIGTGDGGIIPPPLH
ncbi:LOB domain-containing protein 22-like [Zingiber officinale]|uniref:LOB domain-containing protein 22-like n=1 Tax=Zingiber officinale TaxID=94328 RepID=UPI001C4C3E4F|nr:LOB domain-containing protein 22-like [Zingiber officinale]